MIRKMPRAMIFVLLGVIMFFVLQEIFIPVSSRDGGFADYTIQGFHKIAPETIDVLYFGTSQMELGISPVKLYKDTGICSYSLATDAQPIEASYYLLKDAYATQSPKVVFLDVGSLFSEDNKDRNIRWHHVLDNYRLSPIKLEMAKSYSEIKYSDGFWNALFPFFKYHNRWIELSSRDFQLFDDIDGYYSLGQYMTSWVLRANAASVADIDNTATILRSESSISYREGSEIIRKTINTLAYDPIIPERNIEYLLKIYSLCAEHGSQLIMIKIPVFNYPQEVPSTWTKYKSDMVRALADENDIPFLDLRYDMDLGLDWKFDTPDGGVHLNFRGADKATTAIENYLLNNYALRKQNNPQYDEYAKKYEKVHKIAWLHSETDYYTYIDLLEEDINRWTILIAASDDYVTGMDDASYHALEGLGLQLLREGAFRDSYAAVIDCGNVKYEAVSGRAIDHSLLLGDHSVRVYSSGWNTLSGCSLKIDNREYAHGGRGLNIVVFDNETNLVVDSVTFDTWQAAKPALRNTGTVAGFLRAYEKKVCFDEDAS